MTRYIYPAPLALCDCGPVTWGCASLRPRLAYYGPLALAKNVGAITDFHPRTVLLQARELAHFNKICSRRFEAARGGVESFKLGQYQPDVRAALEARTPQPLALSNRSVPVSFEML